MEDGNLKNTNNLSQSDKSSEILSNISPKQLAILANLAAIALCEDRSVDEMNIIGNFVVGIGSLILTVAAQTQLFAAREEKMKEEKMKQIDDLKEQLKQLEDSLKQK